MNVEKPLFPPVGNVLPPGAWDFQQERVPRRVALMPLRLRQASQLAETQTRGQDAGDAGGVSHQAADVRGNLLLLETFFSAAKWYAPVLRHHHFGHCGRFARSYGGVATLDAGCIPCGSSRLPWNSD